MSALRGYSWPEVLQLSDDAFAKAGGNDSTRRLAVHGNYVTGMGFKCGGKKQRFSCTGAPLAFESVHALMNRLKTRFACVRDRKKRDVLMHNALTILKKNAALIAAIDKAESRGKYLKKPKVAAAAAAAA